MRGVSVMAAALGWLAGCGSGPTELPDAGPMPGDSGIGMPDGASPDARQDAGPADPDAGPPDTGVDAATCADICTSTSECATSVCIDGECVETAVVDGTICGELAVPHVCVRGTCVPRGCGDGYRERGPDPPREGCDDGNILEGDACTSTCEPVALVAAGDTTFGADEWDALTTRRGQAVGVDGRGELLLVWTEEYPDRSEVHARRHTRGGVPLAEAGGDYLLIDPETGAPAGGQPVVAGLSSGWVVVWENNRATGRQVLFRIVEPDGTLGPERTASMEVLPGQRGARVAAVDGGFALAWTMLESLDGFTRNRGIRARRFDETGAPLGDELIVPTTRENQQDIAAVAADGEDWMVTWTHGGDTVGSDRVYVRRFRGATAVDSAQVLVSPEVASVGTAAPLGGGSYAVAWVAAGDIHARVLDPGDGDGTAGDVVPITATPSPRESFPVIAPLGDGGYLVAWQRDDRTAGYAAVGEMVGPEGARLATLLGADEPLNLSVAPTGDGTWFLWTSFAVGFAGDVAMLFYLPGG